MPVTDTELTTFVTRCAHTTQDVFPKEVFQCAGAKLLQPEYEPKYKAIYREADLEAGQAIARYGTTVQHK